VDNTLYGIVVEVVDGLGEQGGVECDTPSIVSAFDKELCGALSKLDCDEL